MEKKITLINSLCFFSGRQRIKVIKTLILICALSMFFENKSFAQNRKLQGTVTDQNNEPLPGVTIKVKDSNLATISDQNGSFTLSQVKSGAVLIFSFIGFDTQELTISNESVLKIKLNEKQSQLNEIVVTGYLPVKKRDLTGSVGVVNIEEFNKAPVASFDQALAGRIAGVQVSSFDGQPGTASNIVIRGGNSVTQSNAPLFVIDGFPIEGFDLNLISPSEIQSIEVLKDASSTAIYGARGANGVIIVTTKRGKIGDPIINYNGFVGSQYVLHTIPLLDAYGYVKLLSEADKASTDSTFFKNGKTLADYQNAPGIDWEKAIFRKAIMTSHALSVSGGTDKTRYAISGSIFSQDGVVIASGFNRYQGRIALDQTINTKLKMGVDLTYSDQKTYGLPTYNSNFFANVWGYRPISYNTSLDALQSNLFDPTNSISGLSSGTQPLINPVTAYQNSLSQTLNNNFIANIYVQYNITKYLVLKLTGGLNRTDNNPQSFASSLTGALNNANGINGSDNFARNQNVVNENTLTYTRVFNKNHALTLLGLFSEQEGTFRNFGANAIKVPNETLGISGLDEGQPLSINSSTSDWTLVSGLVQARYTFKNRYLFTGSYRADASSRFIGNNKWSYFPSAAFAWKINEEPFAKNLKFLSEAKLRVSYGVVGNNRVPDFATYASFGFAIAGSYPFNNSPVRGIYPSSVANGDLKWETTKSTDIGFDLGLFDSRVSLTFDVYRKNTTNLLLNSSLPGSTGYNSVFKNIGATQNQGLEVTLSTVNLNLKNFKWTSNFNISFNQNKLVSLDDIGNLINFPSTIGFNSGFSSQPAYQAIIGKPLGQMYGYIYLGTYKFSDFTLVNGKYVLPDNTPVQINQNRNFVVPGSPKFKDINGDGVIDANDEVVIGRGQPIHVGGFSNNFTYKRVDLSVFLQWSYGSNVFNGNKQIYSGAKTQGSVNQFASYADRWSFTNPNSDIPRPNTNDDVYSTYMIEDGSFLRIKTVQLGYTFDSKLVSRFNIKALRIYASAQNLYTFWKRYDGFDPEVSSYNSALTSGFDYSSYPRAGVITFGLNVSL